MISLRTSEGTDWTDDWVHVKVVRKLADGTTEVYWDDRRNPVQTAQSKTFAWGRVGLGSYDDLGDFDHVGAGGPGPAPSPSRPYFL